MEYFYALQVLSIAIVIIALLQCILYPNTRIGFYDSSGYLINDPNASLLIEFYYDAMENDSAAFITDQLIPTYDIIENATKLIMVAYGNTHISQKPDGSYDILCSPQPDQCEPILQHTCIAGIVKDSRKKLRIIKCLMGNNGIIAPTESLDRCSQEFNLTELNEVQECTNSKLSLELLSGNRDMTEEAYGGFYSGPIIIMNETTQPIKEIKNLLSSACQFDQVKDICKTIK